MDVNGATVAFYDFPADCQSDTRARVLRARVQPLEEHKNTFDVLRLDANPIVADTERPITVGRVGRYLHHWCEARLLELDCVGDQVLKELVKLPRVRANFRQISASDGGCRVLDRRAEIRYHLVDYLIAFD
jgi:hypothetical protein